MEKEYVIQIAQTIQEQLIGLTPMSVLMSWGIAEFACLLYTSLYSFNATHPVHSCHHRLVFQTQRWTAALDSVALKCISYKILPFCERVIFRKKRRKSLIRQSL